MAKDTRSKYCFLYVLASASPQQRVSVLETVSVGQVQILAEAAYNIIFNEDVHLPESKKSALKKQMGALKKLASKNISIREKKTFLPKKAHLVKLVAEVAAKYLEQSF